MKGMTASERCSDLQLKTFAVLKTRGKGMPYEGVCKRNRSSLLTIHEMRPTPPQKVRKPKHQGKDTATYQAELDTLLAVSTVPPRTTSFIPSTTDEPPAPTTRG